MTVESQMIIIFGATGDLTRRKILPSLYHLLRKQRLTECTPVICVGRRDLNRKQYLGHLALEQFISNQIEETIGRLKQQIEYVRFDTETDTSEDFRQAIQDIQQRYRCQPNTLVYLALPTRMFLQSARHIDALKDRNGWRRVVFEKPFGEDLRSARQLNEDIKSVLNEEEIFRVDHYLGKELVQNVLTLRFANELFANAWSGDGIEQVQITVSETLGVEKRAGYYDKSGAVKDMLQNHLLQLLCFVAMEPPQRDVPDSLRGEAVRVLQSLRLPEQNDVVLGQYSAGHIDQVAVKGYREEEGVDTASTTETYVALRAFVDTARWRNVPFYLRTGKRLQERYADIKIIFKQDHNGCVGTGGDANVIILRIQPDEGIGLAVNVQKPGEDYATESVLMDFCHHCHFGPNTPEAYESILYNVMQGDHSLFPRADWIESSWAFIDHLLEVAPMPELYSSGTTGPAAAGTLLEDDQRQWLDHRKMASVSFPKAG